MSRHDAHDACAHVAGGIALVAGALALAVRAAAESAAAERRRQAVHARAVAAQRHTDARMIGAAAWQRAFAVRADQLAGQG